MLRKFSRTPRMLRILVAASWLCALAFGSGHIGAAHAATPSSGTVDTSGTQVQWTFAPVVAGDVTDIGEAAVCPPLICDNYNLTVVLPTTDPTTYYQSNTVKLTITMSWNSPVNTDLDLYAFSPSGDQHGPGSPDDLYAGNGAETLTLVDPQPGVWNIRSVASISPLPTSASGVAYMTASSGATQPVTVGTNGPSFNNYAAPLSFGGLSGEPSVGPDWATGDVVYTGTACINCNPFSARIHFDTSTSPPTATWTNVTPLQTSQASLDPIGFMDHSGPTNDRWFMTELAGVCSITAYTDNDGTNWSPSQGCGVPAGVDHETLGGGPYNPNAPGGPLTSYKDAVYYCSQDIATAFCARSDDGGVTFGAGVPIYSLSQCGGLHGHVKVDPFGNVYVPNKDCGGHPSVVVSQNNGLTWTVHEIPGISSVGSGSDPSVTIGAKGTVYFATQGYVQGNRHIFVAVSHDHGNSWSQPLDLGAPANINNIEFAEAIAGDDSRASIAFLGTNASGDDQSSTFPGVWYMFVSTTSNGGDSWTTVNATPNDPVQRGCIWDGGGNNQCRNMLDFNDEQIDNTGRIYIAYTDGCTGACETDPNAPVVNACSPSCTGTYSSVASVLRQASGQLLYHQAKHKS